MYNLSVALSRKAKMQNEIRKNIKKKFRQSIEIQINCLQEMLDDMRDEDQLAVTLISGCKGKIFITTTNEFQLVAKKMLTSFENAHLPTSLCIIDDQNIMIPMITENDVVIVISLEGYELQLLNVITNARERGAKVIAMSGSQNSPLSQVADVRLNIGIDPEFIHKKDQALHAKILALVLGDALAKTTKELKCLEA
jgi:DNA-binding MurR/RpiR family transcriptional regulator